MFSEVCITLTPRCLRTPLLYSAGLVVLRDHTNYVCGVVTTVYRREQDLRRFGWKLDSEDGGERSGRGFALRGLTGDPLAHGEGLEISPELPDRELDPPLWHRGPHMLYPIQTLRARQCMRSWVRISRDATVGGIIFFKAGRTFSPGWCYPPGLKNFSPGS